MTTTNEMTEIDMTKKKKKKGSFLPLIIVVGVIVAFFAFGGADYLSFATLRDNREVIKAWTSENIVLAAIVFMLAYMIAVMFSLPGAVWLSLSGGFIFGTLGATVYITIGATAGAIGIFLVARYALYDFFHAKVGKTLHRMEDGFKENALSYMLVLRLVPLFPFWLVNLVPALLGVKMRTYAIGTLLGIIPGVYVYASVGAGLDSVFAKGETPDLSIIFSPDILTPIIGLSVLSMVPVIYKKLKK